MSGEAGGFIIAGAIALGAIAVVAAGAAIVGLARGAVRAGRATAEFARQRAEQKAREKELVVNQCSAELDNMYQQMRQIVSQETNAQANFASQTESRFQELSSHLEQFRNTHPSLDALNAELETSRHQMQNVLSREFQETRNQIVSQGTKQLQQTIQAIENSLQTRSELKAWSENNAQAVAVQKQTAQQAIQDAQASAEMLKGMRQNSNDPAFSQQVDSILRTLNTAVGFFEQNLFQSAFSSARTVIRTSAMLASAQVQKEIEMDMLRMEFVAKLESLSEEMQIRRYMEFCDETRADKKQIKADLNKFSQGRYSAMQTKLSEQIAFMNSPSSERLSVYEMQKLADTFERETEPDARHIMETSIKVMGGYYERRNALDIIAGFMKEQGYQMEWAMPEGNDASQKLAVNFKHLKTQNAVTVTLDYDVNATNLANMAMEVLTFYQNGRPVTEAEKQQLRQHLVSALKESGLDGALQCTGSLNQPSGQTEMLDKQAVKNKKPKRLV